MGIKGKDFVMVCSDTSAAHSIIAIKHDEVRAPAAWASTECMANQRQTSHSWLTVQLCMGKLRQIWGCW